MRDEGVAEGIGTTRPSLPFIIEGKRLADRPKG